ncbi:hypothetical protein MPSEU_000330100 [Mayamaea pseudoterrestris]|nr:hypothetical protein MPSEU_000330100 [Mayamaea pseudoterrestris]
MNISLNKKQQSKKSSKLLGFGLNKRNVLSAGDSDDDDENSNDDDAAPSSRSIVNQAIAQEQSALRQRAEAALKHVSANDVYDYDGAYDDIHAKRQRKHDEQESLRNDNASRQSRYTEQLLKTSRERKFQHEIIMERKIAKEQEAESMQADFRDKDVFVTASYKRKLQERNLWLAQEKERDEKEESVESKGMAGFYGGLNTNVALGHGENEVAMAPKLNDTADVRESTTPKDEPLEFMNGFERANDHVASDSDANEPAATEGVVQNIDPNIAKREQIEKKLADARIRYFKRHNMLDKLSQ